MTLWLVLALMTAVALAALFLPFAFGGGTLASGNEVAVYKDQLVEIDRDLKAGLIGAADAEAARIEVSRRLLSASKFPDSPRQTQFANKTARTRRLSILVISTALLPILAGGMYLRLGSPGYASAEKIVDQPAPSPDDARINAMLAEVEGYLRDNPNDGHGWETLAPIYLHMGRYEESARAWRNAIANLGDSGEREESLGEALYAAANGVVTDEARKAFNRALSIDRDSVDARFYIGLAAKQDGRPEEAARIWRELIATAPPDADWTDTVRDALAQLEQPPIASADSATLSDPQQAAMIESMVERLSERLKANGNDPDGWLKLIRSYNVLGERDKAQTALAEARRALTSDPDKLARFEQALKSVDGPIESVPQEVARQPAPSDAAPSDHDSAQAMVQKLAERLRTTGGDADSWLMLVRSYEALGQRNNARTAIAQARQVFASDPEKLSYFDQLLRAAGIPSSPTLSPQPSERRETQKPTAPDAAPAEQRMAMIQGMVDRLAARLNENGHDVDGWIRLMRSYVVLGQHDQAVSAGQRARIALGNDADAVRKLNAGAKELGLDLP